jgi:hypothetical protein
MKFFLRLILMNWLKWAQSLHLLLYHYHLNPTALVGSQTRRCTVAPSVEIGLKCKLWKRCGRNHWSRCVCLFFYVVYKAKTLVQIYFSNYQFTPTVYFKKRCWYCVLLHTTSKITINTLIRGTYWLVSWWYDLLVHGNLIWSLIYGYLIS